MPRLTDLDRARAIGQLQAGVPQNQVAALFGVSPSTISKLKAKFHITGDVRDRPRSGRPKKTTPQEDTSKVWRRRGERYADCCTDRVTSFGGGSVMVWGGISLTGKTRLVIIGGNLNAERYRDEILQPVAIPYLHSLGPNSILQDDNARPHRAGFIRDYLQNLGVERMEPQPH